MTLNDAIAMVDELKPNVYSKEQKINWINEVEGRIKKEIIDTHVGFEKIPFEPYTPDSVGETLIAEPPYDSLYVRYLEMQIDYANAEYNRYNNSMMMFDTAYGEYRNYYNRVNMPLGKKMKF